MSQLPRAKFEVSSPGKIILHGEHSVVYGKPSIAGPIGLKTSFVFEESQDRFIQISYERFKIYAKMSIENANLLLKEMDCHQEIQPLQFLQKVRESKAFILKYVETSVEENRLTPLSDNEEMAVVATLYQFNRILRSENIRSIEKPFNVKIDSTMSIGAGVGSSASYAVCLAAGFYIYTKILTSNLDLESFSFNEEDLDKISKWAFDSEVIMHEKPSGIDNTICTYGKLIKFLRGQPPIPINLKNSINILLVDTGVGRSTSHLVGKVANLKNKYSPVLLSVFDAIGHLVESVVEILESDKKEDDKYQELGVSCSKIYNDFKLIILLFVPIIDARIHQQ